MINLVLNRTLGLNLITLTVFHLKTKKIALGLVLQFRY